MDSKDVKRGFLVDLHAHSNHSRRPSQWILQKIGCPECFTEPRRLYDVARARGMDLVTITDHNTIGGALEIAHLPGVFVSEEITTYFPEDKCKLHVLAYDVTEAQHDDIQRLRQSVFELVPYLRGQGIDHVLAHPLFAVNDRLTPDHFEQCLVLFNLLEFNGTRDETQNTVLKAVCDSLNRADVERLADKHGLEPFGPTPWVKGYTGGSDDHSSLNIARMHTEVLPDPDAAGAGAVVEEPGLGALKQALRSGRTMPRGVPATPETMAHNLYGIAYQFYKSKLARKNAAKFTAAKHLCFRFADHALDFGRVEPPTFMDRFRRQIGHFKTAYKSIFSKNGSAKELMLREATNLILADPGLRDLADGQVRDVFEVERQWSRFVARGTDRILKQFADRLVEKVAAKKYFDLFHSMGAAGSFYALLAPYFVGYDLFSRERSFCDKVLANFGQKPMHPRQSGLRVAHFTDTFDEVNGVARTIRQQVSLVNRHGKNMRVITCGEPKEMEGVANFAPVGSVELPEYPDIRLHYPPFLEMLAYCFEQDFDFILAATPGPVGLAALGISKILKLPFHGTYHTAFPQYVGALTDDQVLEDGAWRYMIWFYSQMDTVYSPSKAIKKELVDKGLDPDKIVIYPRGVDTARFNPGKRNGFFKLHDQRTGMEKGLKLLYVGRVSKEKDLHVLAETARKLAKLRKDIQLVVVGDGPYLDEMKRALKNTPTVFTGVLEGDDLAQAYASADIFVFPSTTDTFGNVVLEAQASGLPAIVTDKGGPVENIVPDKTGLIAEAGNPDSFLRCILHLADYPERLTYMGEAARRSMEGRTFDATFLRTWEIFGETVRRERVA